MDKTCFVLSPHAAPEPEPTYAGRAFVKMSPGRVVDYPLGLRSQGPEFKSPSGRSHCSRPDEPHARGSRVRLRQDATFYGRYTTSRASRLHDAYSHREKPNSDTVGGSPLLTSRR